MSFATLLAGIQGENPRWQDLASLLEMVRNIGYRYYKNEDMQTVLGSSAFVPMWSGQFSNFEPDDILILFASIGCSVDVAAARAQFHFKVDSDLPDAFSSQPYFVEPSGSQLGRSVGPSIIMPFTGMTGTVTASLEWRRQSGGTTAYSQFRSVFAFKTKTSGII